VDARQQAIARLKARNYAWPIPWEIVYEMAFNEDCRLVAYKCPAGVWTIGWGDTDNVVPGQIVTEDQVDLKFFHDTCIYAGQVRNMCTSATNENQLGALVSLAYNIGLGGKGSKKGLYASSVLSLHNQGKYLDASRAFNLYNKATVNGVLSELSGLTARRAMEGALYLRPIPGDLPTQVPVQEVAPPSSLTVSPIAVAGGATGVSGVVKVVTEYSDQAKTVLDQVASTATTFGLNPGMVLGVVLLVAGAVAVYYRYKQRSGGWA
jgi:lysozyme